MTSAVAIALCRAGFELEAAGDLAALAEQARAKIACEPLRGEAVVVGRFESVDPTSWRAATLARPPIFIRSLWTGTGPHRLAIAGTTRPDRIAPLVDAAVALAAASGHEPPWRAPWIEYPDTNDGKALSTLARALEGRLAASLRERGLVDDAARRQAHTLLVDGTTAYVGTADPDTGSPWPLGFPRLRMPREAPSRSTLKLAEAIAVFLGPRDAGRMREGQSAVDLGAAPGGWTWQLVERGLHVTAVDNGALAPSLARHPNVEHIRADALSWRSKRPVDWLVCDVVERPSRIAVLVADGITTGRAREAIFNLKLPMKKRRDEALACAALIRDRIAAAGLDARVALRHLYHDREEVTGCVLQRR